MPLRAHYERTLSAFRLGRPFRGTRLLAFLVEINQPLRIEIHPARNLPPNPPDLGNGRVIFHRNRPSAVSHGPPSS